MKNHTFEVMTLMNCGALGENWHFSETICRQAHVGCMVLNMLQDIYKFNITYVFDDVVMNNTGTFQKTLMANMTTDIFVRPMALDDFTDIFFPVFPVFTWRYGFIVRRESTKFIRAYYSLPFNRIVWRCLIAMILLVTFVFFTTHWWEHRILRTGRPSLNYEFLVAVGAYCQHVLPVQAHFQSRKLAYFVFFLFSYVIYSFYSTTLLSHMVTDRDNTIDLEELETEQYKIVTIDNMQNFNNNFSVYNNSFLKRQLDRIIQMDVESAVLNLKTRRVALLSDFNSVYPVMRQILTSKELCEVIEIEIFSNIHKYLLTSKKFKFKEQFKIGTIRLKEAGLLNRITKRMSEHEMWHMCSGARECERLRVVSILGPVLVLSGACCLSLLVLAGERLHYERNRVFPFVN